MSLILPAALAGRRPSHRHRGGHRRRRDSLLTRTGRNQLSSAVNSRSSQPESRRQRSTAFVRVRSRLSPMRGGVVLLLREEKRRSNVKTLWRSGTGSNCRPSAFQEVYHPESTYPEKPPTAQLTRIHAGRRLFSVHLTRITSVPECAVSSVGFLWGSAIVSPTCWVSVGLAEGPDLPGRPNTGT
jgi:hypothetical protein